MTNLHKPADLGKAALTIASMFIVPGPLATGMAVAGEAAGFLINCVNWDKEGDNRIAAAVQNALRQVKTDVPPGAQRIVDELIASADSPFTLEERIEKTESYLLQCETPQTRRDIAQKFQVRFRVEMRKFPDLHILLGMLDGLLTVLGAFEARMQDHDLALCSQEQMISALQAELERLKRAPVLCLPGAAPGVRLIGRENDLADFAQKTAAGGKICVVSGIGGVGKTEFIKTYLAQGKDTLGRIGWFDYRNSFRDTLLAVSGFVLHSCSPVDDLQARYNEIMGLLRQLKAEDLLVFDNVARVESAADMDAILALPCKVIFTTRGPFDEDKNRLLVYDMAFLSVPACQALFTHYRGEETPEAEQASLIEVIRLAGQHTLALELMAKTCRAAGLTVRELLERLNRDGFNLDGLKEEVRREGGRENKRFLEHMLKLYDIADIKAMGEDARWLLANLSVLPLQDFDIKVLVRWLKLPDRVLLNRLGEWGWIGIRHGDKVTMHAIIAEVIRAALKPDSECCGKLMEAIHESIRYLRTNTKIYQAPYLYCAESVLKHVAGETKSVADFCAQAGFVQRMQGDYASALSNYQRVMSINEKVLGREHPDTAATYNNLASLYQAQTDYGNALKYQLLALAINEKVLGNEHPDTATTYNNLANLYKAQGDHDNALKYQLLDLAISEKILGYEHPDTATTYNNLANLYKALGDNGNALKYYLLALAINEKVLGRDHPDTATTYNNLANLYKSQGDYGNALKYHLLAMSIREKVLGREHPNTATTYNNIASLYKAQGDYENALKYQLLAMSIHEKVLGREHLNTAITYNNLATLYKAQGDYDNALKYQLLDLAITEKVLGREHPDTANSYNNLASLYQAQGDYNNALKYHLLALAIRERVQGKEHPDTATTYNNLAVLYQDQGDYDSALKYQLQALSTREKVLGRDHPDTATTYNNLASLYQSQCDYDNALKYQLLAMAIIEKVLGREHPNTAITYNNLASLYQAQGDYRNALKYQLLDLAISEKVLGREHPDTAITYCNIAVLFLQNSDKEQAVPYAENAYVVFLAKLGEKHEYTRSAKKLLDTVRSE